MSIGRSTLDTGEDQNLPEGTNGAGWADLWTSRQLDKIGSGAPVTTHRSNSALISECDVGPSHFDMRPRWAGPPKMRRFSDHVRSQGTEQWTLNRPGE